MLTNDSQIAEMCGNFHFNFYDILQFYSLVQKTFDFFSVRLRNFLKKSHLLAFCVSSGIGHDVDWSPEANIRFITQREGGGQPT